MSHYSTSHPPLVLEFARTPSATAEFNAAYVGPMGRVEGGLNLIGTLPDVDDLPETASSGDAYIIVGYLHVWTQGGWLNAGPMGGPVGPVGPQGPVGPPGPTTWAGITDKPTLGTASPLNVAATGNAAAGEVVKGDDTRLSDSRTPTGGAGGVLSGSYPNPGFSVDMATQAELDAVNAAKVDKTARGAANGVASLDASGKVPASELPAIAITDVFTVASQAAMLALTAERGDVAVRSDLNKSFALAAEPASTLAYWVELRTPTDAVLSVAGKTGAVTLAKADVGLGNVDNTTDAAKPVSTAQAAAIATATAIHPFLLIGA